MNNKLKSKCCNADVHFGTTDNIICDNCKEECETKLKLKSKKGEIEMYAVCFVLNKKCLGAGTTLFPKRSEAKTYIKEMHVDCGFEEDHHIIKVSIKTL